MEVNINMDNKILKLLEQAATEGVIICPNCNSSLEPDCPECGNCNWKNPLISEGLI